MLISPADSSNELLNLIDRNFVFRTTPSKIRGSKILAEITKDRGIKKVAILTFNDLDNKTFANFFKNELNAKAIETTIVTSHNENSDDYADHISALTAAGGDAVAIISNINSGGERIIKSMLDTGMFNKFIFPEDMIDKKIINQFEKERQKKSFGYLQVLSTLGSKKFLALAQSRGIDASNPYVAESYDAAALIMFAMQASGSSDSTVFKDHVMGVANAPGVQIFPGQLAEGMALLEAGFDIDYVGASAVELVGSGESAGNYREIVVQGGQNTTVKYR